MRTVEELVKRLGRCPICGGKAMIIKNSDSELPELFKDDNCGVNNRAAIKCYEECTDGGPTYCGAQLDAVLDLKALDIQIDRWNGVYNK